MGDKKEVLCVTKEELLKHEVIYGAMYGSDNPEFNCVIDIKISDLKFWQDGSGFYYIWGWPGPDYNNYPYARYGKNWFFTIEEAHLAGFKTWEEEHENNG